MEDYQLTDGVVWLSRPTSADIDGIVECCQEPSISRWTTIPVPYRRVHAEKFLDGVVQGWAEGRPTWALRETAGGPVAGMVDLTPEGKDRTGGQMGFWLVPRLRGRGLMSRAVGLVCEFGFRPDRLGLVRIEWRAMVGNHASAAVARRAGFRYEGRLRLGGPQRGVRHDVWIAGRLATDPIGPAAEWPPGV
ncbi:GNAT family N-acetyltransferase [Nocardia alni]|uniref:GNAT family N-acetyltransferase n=1 Tax=Nocardia alni TaxID=2815723 RepID=UPI001C23C6F9|nr:GNAT family N-acetyltransferase [Nocardia alni]